MNIEFTELEIKLIKQALRIWRGDFPITGEYPNNRIAYPTRIWQKEVSGVIDKIENHQLLEKEIL
jgi:hypothetical protein